MGLIDLADRYFSDRRSKREKRMQRVQRDLTGGADGWLTQEAFTRAKRRLIRGIPDARCFTLQGAIRAVKSIEGDVAECGVRYGKSTAFLLEADRTGRTYHLFDSFQGLSEPSKEDTSLSAPQSHWRRGDMAVDEAETRKNLAAFSNVVFHTGWIPERFPDVADRRFVLLHVDVDLYLPTRHALEFFWPRLASGGIVVCDDYGFGTCPGARQAMDEFFASGPSGVIELSTGQGIAVKVSADSGRAN